MAKFRVTIEEIKVIPTNSTWRKDTEHEKSVYCQLVDHLDVAEVVSFINQTETRASQENCKVRAEKLAPGKWQAVD